MSDKQLLSVDDIVDQAKASPFLVLVWALCFLACFLDGFDLTVIAFLAPELVKEYDIPRSSLGLVFSASVFGMAIGGPLFGWIGDKYGRRGATIACCAAFGIGTLGILWATTAPGIAICRLIAGLGMGGIIPNIMALVGEYTPAQMRSRMLAIVGMAVPMGAILPGILTASLVPVYGWRLLVYVGGIMPLVVAVILLFALPESIKYLALRANMEGQMRALLKKLVPDVPLDRIEIIPAKASFVAQSTSFSPTHLFGGGLVIITLCLWLTFFVNGMVNFLVNSWMPLVFQSMGISAQQSGLTAAMWAVGGMLGGIFVALFLKRLGAALIAIMFAISVPLIALMMIEQSATTLIFTVLVAGIGVGAIQIGINSIPTLIYPTSLRGKGTGWALAIGRVGAILGPFIGSAVIAFQIPPQKMFGFATIPMAVGFVAAVVLTYLCYRRFKTLQLAELISSK